MTIVTILIESSVSHAMSLLLALGPTGDGGAPITNVFIPILPAIHVVICAFPQPRSQERAHVTTDLI